MGSSKKLRAAYAYSCTKSRRCCQNLLTISKYTRLAEYRLEALRASATFTTSLQLFAGWLRRSMSYPLSRERKLFDRHFLIEDAEIPWERVGWMKQT